MEGLIYLPKWSKVLLEIYKSPEQSRYCQRLHREVKSSINHLRNLIRVLEERKMIEICPTKKIKKIVLTEKGRRIAGHILGIESEIR